MIAGMLFRMGGSGMASFYHALQGNMQCEG